MIKSEVVADSLSPQGNRLTSVLVTFPRIILAEVNTHRMLSKNTSSSRAIPFNKMVEAVNSNPFIPIAWQKDHKGMQGTTYLSEKDSKRCVSIHLAARDEAVYRAKVLYSEVGATKQLANRYLEPFMWTTMLITGSKEGWDNFFELRCPQYVNDDSTKTFKSKKELIKHYKNSNWVGFEDWTDLDFLQINKGQAEIHMMALAEAIYDSMNESTPEQLEEGQWHIPFKNKIDLSNYTNLIKDEQQISTGLNQTITDLTIKISTALSARTSYTIIGDEKEIDYKKMIDLYDKLFNANPPHSSVFEHCSKVMNEEEYNSFIKGQISKSPLHFIQAITKDIKGWCRNYRGFIQLRHLIENGESI